MRKFTTGATRDNDTDKLDYEGFLSPLVLERYAQFMHEHRWQVDGKIRASGNWQRGIPQEAYVKSLLRHVIVLWKLWRNLTVKSEQFGRVWRPPSIEDACCAIMFNIMGLLFERLRGGKP